MEALQLGSVQMLAPSLAKFGPLGVKEFEAFDMPFIFPDKQALYRVTDGPVGKALFEKLEPKGIMGLAYWDNGFKDMTANKPLHKPADFKGLKMRIQSSKVLDAQFRALGANPQVMAFSEVYQALQTGVVDGTENTPSNIYTQKMHEVQKHMTCPTTAISATRSSSTRSSGTACRPTSAPSSKARWRTRPSTPTPSPSRKTTRRMEAIKASGKTKVYTLTAAEREAWRKAMAPVYKQMEGRVGKEALDAVEKAAAGK